LALLVLKKRTTAVNDSDAKSMFIQLGIFRFYQQQQLLKFGKEEIPLTSKENQVLEIFASNLNQVIERDQLQKEVWENEGVVVGRSLDVFISKLRKKLEADPALRIVNIHGRGYKLEFQL
jgi:DNA-binding response OmpR family regulator